jgi:hypothetical protein
MGGCRGCGNQITGTYYEVTRMARLLSPPQAPPFTGRKQCYLTGGRSVRACLYREFRPTQRCDIKSFVLRGRTFLLIEVVSGNQIEDKLFSRLTNQLIIDLPKLMMSIVEYDLTRW